MLYVREKSESLRETQKEGGSRGQEGAMVTRRRRVRSGGREKDEEGGVQHDAGAGCSNSMTLYPSECTTVAATDKPQKTFSIKLEIVSLCTR